MSRNINAYLSCLRMLVSVERYPESGRFPIISFKGTSCWGRKIAAFYNYLSTAFSWRTVEYSKNAVQDQQVVPLLQKSSNNDSVRRGQYKFYMTYPPVIWGMPLCGQLRPYTCTAPEMIPTSKWSPINFRNGMVFRHGIITSLLQRLRSWIESVQFMWFLALVSSNRLCVPSCFACLTSL